MKVIAIDGPAAGGTAVRIAGSGLDGATAVRFGSVDAEFQIVSGAQIDAKAPPGAAGVVSVTVVSANGTVAGGKFTYR